MNRLTLTSGISEVADDLCDAVCRYLTNSGVPVGSANTARRHGWMRDTSTDLLWACGYLHVTNLSSGTWPYTALAAPVFEPDRYARSPVYFGDVVVRRGDEATTIRDLTQRRLAYNEIDSFSGYQMLMLELERTDQDLRVKALVTGSHRESIGAVISQRADWAVIDSTILDMSDWPGIRTVTSLGPYPVPPILVNTAVGSENTARVLDALARMHTDRAGQSVLNAWHIRRFVPVQDESYLELLEIS